MIENLSNKSKNSNEFFGCSGKCQELLVLEHCQKSEISEAYSFSDIAKSLNSSFLKKINA